MTFLFLSSVAFSHETFTPWEKIMTSKTLNHLLKVEKEATDYEKIHQGCEVERQKKFFPKNCLKKLDLDMLSMDKPEAVTKVYEEIQGLCREQTSQILSLHHLHSLLKLTSLSPVCRKALEERQKDLDYIKVNSPQSK